MNELITVVNGKPVVTSKQVADHFDKQHRNVLMDIKNLLSDAGEFGELNFLLTSYTSSQNKELPCYEMTRDGFTLLAMGYTGKEALNWKVKYIEAFNEMNRELLDALNEVASSLSWLAHGECRAFGDGPILTSPEAISKARLAIAKAKGGAA